MTKKKKSKKKTTPIYRRGWFTAIAAVLFLAAFGFSIYLIMKPESAESMAEKIDKATTPEAKKTLIKQYLSSHGDLKDERTERIRGMERAEEVNKHEAILLKRFEKVTLKDNVDKDWDSEAHKGSMTALEMELDGNLGAAKQVWKELADKFSADADKRKAVFGWLGARKVMDIDELPRRESALRKRIEKNDVDELENKFDDAIEAKVVAALRFENLKDFLTARERWLKLKEELAKNVDQRPWLMLAAFHIREIDGQKDKMKAEDREKLLTETLEKARKDAYEGDTLVDKREGRNRLRDLKELYELEIESLKKFSTQAAQLLKAAPKG